MARDWYWRSGAKPSNPDSAPPTLPSCITALFHLFRSHSPLNHQTTCSRRSRNSTSYEPRSFFSQDATSFAGTEAPRNSLESEGEPSTSASLTSTSKEDEILNIPMGIQIKTSGDIRFKIGAPNHDIDTPGTRTPTLVARLMGLDLLPETSSSDGDTTRGGTRSLPVTPRISSARWSDVDRHHPRLSLQINKENMSDTEELIMSRLSSLMKRKELKHEHVKQVKQRVARKVGMNITNAVPSREELVSHFKYKKIAALTKVSDDSSVKFLVSKRKSTTYHNPQSPKSPFLSSPRIQKQTSHKLQPVEEEQDEQQQPRAASKFNKGSNKKFVSRLKKPQQALGIVRNKKEEPFVRHPTANRVNIPYKKCRKTPLSNELLNSKVPTLLLVKKDPSPPATKAPQKQVSHAQRPKHNSSSSTQTYIKQEPQQAHISGDKVDGDRCKNATISTGAGDEAEYEYIRRILRRNGLNKDTQVSISSWFSPSHPLDPSIFYFLEHSITSSSNDTDKNNEIKSSQLSLQCNRKLLFHLVDELLSEILKPCFNMKPWVKTNGHGFSYTDGSRLIDTLCWRIRKFPQSDCRVLEDIDALFGRDLRDVKVQRVMAYEEQGEGIVAEIEKDILETLVYEMAVEC
ncbi:hypothetical protein V6N12_047127 [Hibiscus sabdariffa]|uniref:DUF4378 domain-containing protein n=1 Tax=Hibiscus sabdariffa TaxID=183260 RepID=A0ABR2AN67_9ROSI